MMLTFTEIYLILMVRLSGTIR